MKLTVLGARGSMAISGIEDSIYGGATSAYLLETKDQAIFLDAGTGLLDAPEVGEKKVSILLTHPHADHMLGLPMFYYFFRKGRKVDLYAVPRGGLSAKEQVEKLISPPLWPVSLDVYPGEVEFHDITGPFSLGDVQVDLMESNHPGGSAIYGLNRGGHRIVYATDFEHTEEKLKELAEFSQDASLVLYDGQYTEEEYPKRKGFGHSTQEKGLELQKMSGAKKVMIVHHDPYHTDEELARMEEAFPADRIVFAKEKASIVFEEKG